MSGTRVDKYPEDGDETCPECGKKAVVSWDVLECASLPPIRHFVWWCKCGWVSDLMEWQASSPPTLEQRHEQVNA